jgi:hypothetical protein
VLTVGTQPQVEGSDRGIAANSRHRGHIQDAPDLCATAPDTTATAQAGVTPFRWTVLGCGTKCPADDSFRS